jgi:hypothetical protein
MAKFELPPIDIRKMTIKLIGDTPLIVHAWSHKAKQEMLDKQMKKAKAIKEAKDPDRDYRESLYVISEAKDGAPAVYGFPVIAFKASAVTACTSLADITKVAARQAFHILGEMAVIDGIPRKREDMVRIGMGTADLRYRGEFDPWGTTLTVAYNASVLSEEQIANMFNIAGFAVGVGEWRPEKDGNMGRFHVVEN